MCRYRRRYLCDLDVARGAFSLEGLTAPAAKSSERETVRLAKVTLAKPTLLPYGKLLLPKHHRLRFLVHSWLRSLVLDQETLHLFLVLPFHR